MRLADRCMIARCVTSSVTRSRIEDRGRVRECELSETEGCADVLMMGA